MDGIRVLVLKKHPYFCMFSIPLFYHIFHYLKSSKFPLLVVQDYDKIDILL